MENETLNLLEPIPQERLSSWLEELYGKPVQIEKRELLRHRDLSFVERLYVSDAFPASVIYKLVLPPFDIEHELLERILIPSITNSPRLYMTAHLGNMTAMLMEDLGTRSLETTAVAETATQMGRDLARIQRAYSYRIDDLIAVGILPTILPIDYEDFTARLTAKLGKWQLISTKETESLSVLAGLLASRFAGEPISLVHGDLYAQNVLVYHNRLYIIDWSYFTFLGVPLMDLATIVMDHPKNGRFFELRDRVIEAYCFESGRAIEEVKEQIPYAETLSRVLFLQWLADRRERGIMGTTVGPVDDLIKQVVAEIADRSSKHEC